MGSKRVYLRFSGPTDFAGLELFESYVLSQ